MIRFETFWDFAPSTSLLPPSPITPRGSPFPSGWSWLSLLSFIMALASLLFCRRRLKFPLKKLQSCCRSQPRPRAILAMAICRLFISPSSSGAERLSQLKELSNRARNRFNTWTTERDRFNTWTAEREKGSTPRQQRGWIDINRLLPHVHRCVGVYCVCVYCLCVYFMCVCGMYVRVCNEGVWVVYVIYVCVM